MNSYLPMNEADIREDLCSIVSELSHTRHQISRMIGINNHTLNTFILATKKPSRITLAKIKKFIKDQRS